MVNADDLGQAYARYGPALVRKAERMLRDREAALDLVHGLFVDLVAKRQATPQLPYLYQAITRRALNYLRDTANRSRLLDQEEQAVPVPVRTPLEGRAVSRNLLCRLVEQLDDRDAEVLVYVFVDDLTQEEAASLLGVSRRTVVSRLGKIRQTAKRIAEEASVS